MPHRLSTLSDVLPTSAVGGHRSPGYAAGLHRRRRLVALGAGVLALCVALSLGACSANGGAASSAADGSVIGAPAAGPAGAAPGLAGRPEVAKAGPGAVAPVVNRKLVRTATLRMRVDRVAAAAADVQAIAVGLGGIVSSENISSGDPHDGTPDPTATGASSAAAPGATNTAVAVRDESGTMTLQVPAAKLDAALDQLAKLGTVLQRTTSSDDVTSTYVDTSSRIATMKASIDRIRALMARTTAIDQIVTIETELSKREADLESLQATLATLDAQTTMSTVSLSLATRIAPTPAEEGGSGFLYGLRGGWSAFTSILAGLVTGLGALLPFLAALVLVGVPVRLWWRRRAVSTTAPSPSTPSVTSPAVASAAEEDDHAGPEAATAPGPLEVTRE